MIRLAFVLGFIAGTLYLGSKLLGLLGEML